MRRLFDELTRQLKDFRGQRDHLVLLVACSDDDVALLLKALRDLDRDSPSDLFLLFGDGFENSDSYVTHLASQLDRELALVNGAPSTGDASTGDASTEGAATEGAGTGAAQLPPLPPELFDQTQPPARRLISGLTYARTLIDPAQGQKYVWGLGPRSIADPASYLELLAQLSRQRGVAPWMRGARIVARVPADFQLASSPLAGVPLVTLMRFAIPHDAHEQELSAVSADPKVPLADRMQAEVQLAYLDSAHGRTEIATDRFNRALAFYQWVSIPEMEGLILCGLGDMARNQKDWSQAQHWYACAVGPCAAAGSLILLASVVQNLALVAWEEQRWKDAEARYSELAQIKRGMLDETGLAEALEWLGMSQERQNAWDRAALSWEEAALVCKSFDLQDRLVATLPRLRRGYERLGMHDELATFDADWNA